LDLLITYRIPRPATPGLLRLPNNRTLTDHEMRGLVGIYWPPSEVQNAVAISECESGWETGAWAYIGEDSRGLFQLNIEAHPEMGLYALGDPQINCYWAHWLWSQQGWHPWSCARRLGII
jgi:hypothetical protein